MESLGPVAIGTHAPDLPDLGNPGGEEALNCLPLVSSYGPLRAFEKATTTPLTGQALGAISVRDDNTGLAYTYAGTAADLWRIQDAAWTSAGAGTYTATSWEFAQWANRVVATSLEEKTQVITLGASSFGDLYPTENFSARHVAVVRNQLVFGYVNDGDGVGEARVRWSAFENIDDIVPSKTTLAGFQDLRGSANGSIRKVVGGTTGVIFREKGIWRMEFVGVPFIFRFDELEESVGTIAAGSVVRYGDRIFFLSEDGFRVISPQSASTPIGEERVDRTVLADLNTSFVGNITGALLEKEQAIMWAYPGSGSPGGRANKLVVYNFASDRWSQGEELVDLLFPLATPFTSIDALGPLYGSIDDVPGSLDDDIYSGGVFSLGGIDHNGDAGAFIGAPKTATFTTKEIQHVPGRRTFVNYVRPLVDGGSAQVQLLTRNNQKDSLATTSFITENADGLCPIRSDARYHRYRMEVSGDYDHALGVEPYGRPSGKR